VRVHEPAEVRTEEEPMRKYLIVTFTGSVLRHFRY
jgi:hypothetical protein